LVKRRLSWEPTSSFGLLKEEKMVERVEEAPQEKLDDVKMFEKRDEEDEGEQYEDAIEEVGLSSLPSYMGILADFLSLSTAVRRPPLSSRSR
jgi:hypothetical protein